MTPSIPQLGFGTYGRRGEEGIAALLHAIETGYRHFDTAQDYDTEREVGEAIRRSGLSRDEFFVTTKIKTDNYAEGRLVPSLERSREILGLDQIDLTLLHWPSPDNQIPLATYVPQLAEAQERGLTRLIGVSNFTIALIKDTEALLAGRPLATNQVELNPHLQNKTLAAFCTGRGIAITCYLPIAHGTLGSDETLRAIAERHGATPEQVAIAFELKKGYIAIPTSSRFDRIESNYAALNVKLSSEDMALIETLDRGSRRIDPAWGPDWD